MRIYLRTFFSLSLLSLLSGCVFLSSTGEVEVSARDSLVSPEQEHHFGRAVSASILEKYPLLDQKAGILPYLNKVGLLLANYSKRPVTFAGYRFAIIKTKQPVAFSAPGGFIYISTGLVELL